MEIVDSDRSGKICFAEFAAAMQTHAAAGACH